MGGNLTGINAKDYERIANRISLPQSQQTVERQKEDAFKNIRHELSKEGHTGRLSAPDGLVTLKPFPYKGFVVELYGRIEYMSQFDIYGQLRWIGLAKGLVNMQGKEVEITFDIESTFKHGLADTEDAAKYLIGLIESYRNNKH